MASLSAAGPSASSATLRVRSETTRHGLLPTLRMRARSSRPPRSVKRSATFPTVRRACPPALLSSLTCSSFTVIHIPARYIARVAQAFTATQPSITLQASQVHQIPDVDRIDPTTGRATCFTDGVGTISQVLAAEVDAALVAVLKNPRRRVRPTCWQVSPARGVDFASLC